MKTAIILLLIWQSAISQERPWQKLNMDSTDFSIAYGTTFQYNYQKQVEMKSSHKNLFVWTGAQYLYMYDFAYFLGAPPMNYNVSFDDQDKLVKVTATPKISNTKQPYKIVTIALLNKNAQITSATITGPTDDLINLFVKYWELTPISLNELNTKKIITKEFVSDKVSISLKDKGAIITIVKNKNAPMDLFPFKL